MKKAIILAAVSLLGLAQTAQAQWTVIDPTNLVQNITTAMQTVKQVQQAVQQTQQQIQMAKKMADDVKGLNVTGLLQNSGSDMAASLSRLTSAAQDFKRLESSLGNLQARMDLKIAGATAAGMTPKAFLQKQLDEQRAGSQQADAIIQRDQSAMTSAQGVIKQAEQWRGQIGSLNSNLGGSMQLMNTQLNQLANTNAVMMSYMAQASTDRQNAAEAERAKQAAAASVIQSELAPNATAQNKAAAALKAGFDQPMSNVLQTNK